MSTYKVGIYISLSCCQYSTESFLPPQSETGLHAAWWGGKSKGVLEVNYQGLLANSQHTTQFFNYEIEITDGNFTKLPIKQVNVWGHVGHSSKMKYKNKIPLYTPYDGYQQNTNKKC